MVKIGIIGSGNMGEALIAGWTKGSPQLAVYSPHHGAVIAQKYQIKSLQLFELIKWSDILVLAFLPQQLAAISAEIAPQLSSEQSIISVLGGITLDQIAAAFPQTSNLVRTMPNTNIKVNAGEIAYFASKRILPAKLKVICALLSELGDIFPLSEAEFATFGAIAGSGPAIVAKFAESLVLAGVKNGLERAKAVEIVSKLIMGTLKNTQETEISFNDLMYQIATPGGSTIQGLTQLEETAFSGNLIAAFDRMINF